MLPKMLSGVAVELLVPMFTSNMSLTVSHLLCNRAGHQAVFYRKLQSAESCFVIARQLL